MPQPENLLDALEADRQAKGQAGLATAWGLDPDQQAKVKTLAKSLGVAPAVVSHDMTWAENLAAQRRAEAALSQAPKAQQWIADPENAAVASDSTEHVGWLERTFSGIFNIGGRAPAGGALDGAGTGISGIGEMALGVDDVVGFFTGKPRGYDANAGFAPGQFDGPSFAANRDVNDGVLDGSSWGRMLDPILHPRKTLNNTGEGMKLTGDGLKWLGKKVGPRPEDQSFATDVTSAVGQVLGQAALARVAPRVAPVMFAGQGADIMADRARATGTYGTPAGTAGIFGGALVTGLSEKLAIDNLLGRIPPKMRNRLMATVLDIGIAGGVEAGQEVIEGAGHNLLAKGLYDPGQEIFEGWQNDAAVAGTAGAIVRALLNTAIPGRAHALHGEQADRAIASVARLDEIAGAVQGNPLLQRDPERYAALMNQLADGGEVFIPADTMRSYLQSLPDEAAREEFLREAGLADQYNAAMAAGADLVVPAGEYLTKIAPAAHTVMRDEIRLGMGEMSLKEAEVFRAQEEEALQEIARRGVDLAREQSEASSPAEEVYNRVFSMLREANYTIDASRRQATLIAARYETRGARLGINAVQAFDKSGLSIRADIGPALRKRHSVGRTDIVIDALRDRRKGSTKSGPSLLSFLAKRGGLADPGGELAAMDADKWHRSHKGQRRLVADDGLALDEAAQAAFEAGYFPDRVQTDDDADYYPVTAGDLLEAIRSELAGAARYAAPLDQRRGDFNQAVEQLDELLGRMGVDPDTASNEEIKKAINAYASVESAFDADVTYAQPAYHGTPHEFEGFSLDKIGTGEGAQAFGWGLYFAGRKDVADFYRKSLAGYRNVFFDGVDVLTFLEQDADKLREIADKVALDLPTVEGATPEQVAMARKSWGWASFARVLNDAKGLITNEKGAREALTELAAQYDAETAKELERGDVREAVAEALKGAFARSLAQSDRLAVKQPGRLFEVDIPEDGEYLLFDKPYAEQPAAVKAGLKAAGIEPPPSPPPIDDPIVAVIVKKALAASDGEPSHVEDVIDNDADLYKRAMGHAERRGVTDVAAGEYIVGLAKEHLGALTAAHDMNGERIYRELSARMAKPVDDMVDGGWSVVQNTIDDRLANDKAASLLLRDHGIAGIKFLDGLSRTEGEGSYNYVIFDDTRIAVRSFEQEARGKISFGAGHAMIQLFDGRDLSTLLHESGHLWWEELLTDAADPFAPDQLRDDVAKVREWMGLKDGEPVLVEHHEQFARAAEAYFMEGKAPVPALRDIFQRFKSWLISIYRRVEALNVNLTPEVREVFDRLIATDEEIAAAKDQAKVNPFFATPEDAGMTKAEYDSYTRAYFDADRRATERLTVKVMAAVTRRRKAEWKEERAKVREEVASEVDLHPDLAALNFLRTGTEKLSRSALVDQYGSEAVLARLPRGVPPIYSKDGGVGPDALAGVLGYDSGDGLVQALLTLEQEQRDLKAAGDKRRVRDVRIDEETDRLMNERHGDMLSDGSIQEEALELVNDGRRADLLGSEIRYLARKAGRPEGTWTRETMEAWARAQIAVRKAVEVKPAVYLRAERKAGNDAQRALAARKFDEAMDHKFRQLMNMHLYQQATEAAKLVERSVKVMGRFSDARTWKSMDQDYLDRIHDLLERIDFRRATQKEVARRLAFKAWVEERQANGDDIDPPTRLMDDAFRQHYTTMTVEELQGLFDTIQNIAHLGRLKKRLLTDQNNRDFDAAADTLADSILTRTSVRKFKPPADRVMEKGIELKDNFFGSHRKAEHFVRALDGFENLGPAWQLLYRSINKAGDEKNVRLAKIASEIGVMFRDYSRVERTRMNLARTLHPEIGMSLSKWQVITMALNWGNEGNRDALTEGLGLLPSGVEAVLDKAMDERDWKFVQSVWSYLDGFYPEIAALERRMTGVEPERIEAVTFSTRFGEMKGGYYPLKYDAVRSDRAHAHQMQDRAKLMTSGGFTRPATRKGHTKERVGSGGQPVRLDINVLFEHLHDVVHDLTHREAVIDTNRLLADDRVSNAIKATAGHDAHRQMVNWVRDIAGGDVIRTDFLDKTLNYLRAGVTIANMGWKFSTAIVQPMGYTQSIAEVTEKYALIGLAKFFGSPLEIGKKTEWVMARSAYMRGRIKSFDRDMHDAAKSLGPGGLTAGFTVKVLGKDVEVPGLQQSFFYAIALMDRSVSLPTWIAGYEKGLAEGMEEDQAAEYADSVVRRTQSSGLTKDLAAIQRGGTAQKLFTSFYSFFSATWNMNVDEVKKLRERGIRYAPRFAANMLWINIIPSLLTAYILGRGPDDDEEWWTWATANVLGYVGGGLIGVRDIAQGLTSDFGYGGSPTLAVFEEAVNLGKQVQQGEADRALARSATNFFGPVLHVPSRQMWITSEATTKLLSGEDVELRDFFLAPTKK